MEDSHFGFDVGKMIVGLIRMLKENGVLEEEQLLDMLWEAKEPEFPWSKEDIKLLLKL